MIFRRDASDEWLEMQKLTRTSAEIIDANFGTSVEIWKSRTVAVAAEGEEAVYCFEYSNVESAWVQTARLTSPSSQGTVHFGASLALGDTVLAIGAPAEQVTGKARAGAVHIFNRNATDGSYLHSETLHPVQIAAENRFGFGMALRDPGLLVVSAIRRSEPRLREHWHGPRLHMVSIVVVLGTLRNDRQAWFAST